MFEVQQCRSIYRRVRNGRALGVARSDVTAMAALNHDPSIHDWDTRAADALAEAQAMPRGSDRNDALKKAGKLRVAADMKRLLRSEAR
jgi:hypothetical protein